MKKPALIIGVLILLVVVLSVVRIFVSNKLSTSGVVLGKVSEQIAGYKLENILLAEKLYEASSLTNLSEKAYDIGYTDNKTDFVLDSKLPVAIKQ